MYFFSTNTLVLKTINYKFNSKITQSILKDYIYMYFILLC